MFKHYIITRFNVRVDEWKHTKNNESVLTEDWLSHRFHLFQTYCLPSLINQENQKFTWLVFFDTSTDEEYRKTISAISERFGNFKPIFINGYNEFLPTLIEYISNDLKDEGYVITSRVDNDDCIHRDFVNEIQNKFDGQKNCVVDIIDGYQIILNENHSRQIVEFRKARGYFNPFISLIEKASDLNTVMSREHLKWRDTAYLVTISNKRLWGEIIHHKNKLNSIRPLARPTKKIDCSAFALNKNNIQLNGALKYLKNMTHVEYLRVYYLLKRNTPAGLKKTILTPLKNHE